MVVSFTQVLHVRKILCNTNYVKISDSYLTHSFPKCRYFWALCNLFKAQCQRVSCKLHLHNLNELFITILYRKIFSLMSPFDYVYEIIHQTKTKVVNSDEETEES